MNAVKRLKPKNSMPLRLKLPVLATFSAVLFVIPSYAAQKFHLSNEFSQTYNNIAGAGKSQSSLTEGMRFLDVLNANGAGNLSERWTYNFNIGAKATDDIKNDSKVFSLTNMNLKLTEIVLMEKLKNMQTYIF